MLTTILILISTGAFIWASVKYLKAMSWHHGGLGERKAKAEYGRIKRDDSNSADAQLSEAEFIDKFIAPAPKALRYGIILMLICFVALPASCAVSFL